ncbi:hypothetical protein RDWZM_008225 [Blomia tropicalis]|uniref:Uncharacterized protein n=1 Tax=Blomia tropicalis TaxID=40697 RepID=A0A9Q0LYY4_BLOTA|nr:hypothetical protein RDWZM_008225 [Blomia tropicalis]
MAQTNANPMFTEQLINRICCNIINRLLISLNCFSTPINDLHQLDDGVILVELIECFEDTMFVKIPKFNQNNDKVRTALSRTRAISNMDYVEKWLQTEGVSIDSKRSIKEIFAEIRRSSQELNNFLNTFTKDELNDGTSLGSMLHKQQIAIYGRSIAYISALCYTIFTIFLKNGEQFRRIYKDYDFQVQPDELLHILFYTKWKLTEEELLLKDLEHMRLKDAYDLIEIENRRLTDICNLLNTKRDNSQQTIDSHLFINDEKHSSPQEKGERHSTYSTFDIQQKTNLNDNNNNFNETETCSSITISSLAEMKNVSIQTDICGLENEILVRYKFIESTKHDFVEYDDIKSIKETNHEKQVINQEISKQRSHESTQQPVESFAEVTKPNHKLDNISKHNNVNDVIEYDKNCQNEIIYDLDNFETNKMKVELALTGKRTLFTVHEHPDECKFEHVHQTKSPSNNLNDNKMANVIKPATIHSVHLENIDDEQLRNRILIARLLAELSYEKNKSMKQQQLRQTNQDYI